MPTHAPKAGYSGVQIVLHWLVAVLVLAAWFLGDGLGRTLYQKTQGAEVSTPLHVWLGLAVIAVMVLRWILRAIQGAPTALPEATDTEAKLRHWGHMALYVLLFAVPDLGVVTWFGNIRATGDVHALLANFLLIVAGGHAVVALYHHYVRKDGTLRRMFRPNADAGA